MLSDALIIASRDKNFSAQEFDANFLLNNFDKLVYEVLLFFVNLY